MNKNHIFTSESVTEGHPDKICDQIADATLAQYPYSNMAVSPYPDDVEFGCGGILFKLNKEQYHITVLCNTCFDVVDCTGQSQKRIRLVEQSEACEIFYTEGIIFDKTFWMGWKQNSLLGINFLYSMYR